MIKKTFAWAAVITMAALAVAAIATGPGALGPAGFVLLFLAIAGGITAAHIP